MTKILTHLISRVNVNATVLMLLQLFGLVGNYFQTSFCCSFVPQKLQFASVTCRNINNNSSMNCLQDFLTNISTTFPSFSLEIMSSDIDLLGDEFFEPFNIVELQMIECSLIAVPVALLPYSCPKITGILGFSSNQITQIANGTFASCSEINVLDLSNNQITVLYADSFQGATAKLQSLFLYSNMLISVSADAFRSMHVLVLLAMNENSLQTLVDGTFADVPMLQSVALSDNSFVCNCSLQWLQNWLRLGIVDNDDPQCTTPPLGSIVTANLCPTTTTTSYPITDSSSRPPLYTTMSTIPPTSTSTSTTNYSTTVSSTSTSTSSPLLITDFSLTDDLIIHWTTKQNPVMILYGPADNCSRDAILQTFGSGTNEMHMVVTDAVAQYQAIITTYDDTSHPYLACITLPVNFEKDPWQSMLDALACNQSCRITSQAPKPENTVQPSTDPERDVVALVVVSTLCGIVMASVLIGVVACCMKSRRRRKREQLEQKLLHSSPWQPKPPIRPRTIDEGEMDTSAYIEPSQVNVNVGALKNHRIRNAKEAARVTEALYNNSYMSLEPSMYLALTDAGFQSMLGSTSNSYCSLNSRHGRRVISGRIKPSSRALSPDARHKIWVATNSSRASNPTDDHRQSFSQSSRDHKDLLY